MLVFDELETLRVASSSTASIRCTSARRSRSSCAEYGVDHIDLNFGCPVPKVTRKGGGGALPWKRGLLGDIVDAAVGAAAPYESR